MRTSLYLLLCAGLGTASAAAVGDRLNEIPTYEMPQARIYVLVEPGPRSPPRPVERAEVFAGDVLHVTVESPTEAYLTLLAFDGEDRLVVVGRHNEPRPESRGLWQAALRVDSEAGREQIVAIVASRPVAIGEVLTIANRATSRVERLVLLKETAGGADVLPGPEYVHL